MLLHRRLDLGNTGVDPLSLFGVDREHGSPNTGNILGPRFSMVDCSPRHNILHLESHGSRESFGDK